MRPPKLYRSDFIVLNLGDIKAIQQTSKTRLTVELYSVKEYIKNPEDNEWQLHEFPENIVIDFEGDYYRDKELRELKEAWNYYLEEREQYGK